MLGVFGRSDNAARCRSCRRAPAGDYRTALIQAALFVRQRDRFFHGAVPEPEQTCPRGRTSVLHARRRRGARL